MDFRPPTERSSFIFSPLNRSYFFEQSRRGVLGTDRPEIEGFGDMFRPSYDPVRESILRNIEKGRIREEMIVEEIRRRELEAEVRRELEMESLSTYPGPSDPKVSRTGVRMEYGAVHKLPFQRSTAGRVATEVNVGGFSGGKKMGLGQPVSPMASTLAGTKRKAVEGSSKVSSSGDQRENEWSCDLCQITVTSQQGLDEHVLGKKHKHKLAQIRPSKMANKSITNSTLLVKTGESLIDKRQTSAKHWCELCQVGCNTPHMMEYHRKGKKHQAQLKRMNIDSETSSATTKKPTTGPAGETKCVNEESREKITEGADGVDAADVVDEDVEKKGEGVEEVGLESADAVETAFDTVTEEVEDEAEQLESEEGTEDNQTETVDGPLAEASIEA